MVKTMVNRSYAGVRRFLTFEERFDYLSLGGGVGHSTFGHDRYLNQQFYNSLQWKTVRRDVIVRDEGMDLGIDGYPIFDKPIVHHIVPMTPEDFENGNPLILDPNNLILVSHDTHNAIHFGTRALLKEQWTERQPGDTVLW
jgi:hypothetical protein